MSPFGDVIEAPLVRETVEPVTPAGYGISGISSSTTPGAVSGWNASTSNYAGSRGRDPSLRNPDRDRSASLVRRREFCRAGGFRPIRRERTPAVT